MELWPRRSAIFNGKAINENGKKASSKKTPTTEFFYFAYRLYLHADPFILYLGKEKCSTNQIIKMRDTPHTMNMVNK